MWKNIVERGKPQMTIWHMALHAGYLRLQINTQFMDTHCFSTATVVARTRLNVNVVRELPVMLKFIYYS